MSIIDSELAVLLLKRPYEPFKDMWALPGGYVPENMTADEAASFQLKKKTGIEDSYLEQLALFSSPNRDPRSNLASMAYLGLVDFKKTKGVKTEDALGVQWVKLSELSKLAFDHNEIIEKAKDRMINKIRYTKVGFELVGEEFTLKSLIDAFEAVTGKKLDQSNVRKKMMKLNLLVKTNKLVKDTPGRPSPLYRLNQDSYHKLPVSESFFT